jgi:hypothetical protein
MWLKQKSKPTAYIEAALSIPEMGEDLIHYIKMLDPDADISEIEKLMKKDWSIKAQEIVSKMGMVPEPTRPKTKQPNLSWYDRELDQKLDDERRRKG